MAAATPSGPFRSSEIARGAVAVGLSFCLWYFVADEEGAEILVSAPLELRHVPAGLEVVNQSVQQVDVRLRGASGLLRDAPLQGLSAHVDLAGEAPGVRTWFLGPEAVEAPSGVQVMRVDPSQVVLRLDRTLTTTVRVSPRVLGSPASGFEIHRIAIEPRELAVEGPESLLRDVEQITTEPISAQGLRETYSQRLQIELDPALRPSLRRVDVRLHIGEEREAREMRLAVRRAPGGAAEDPRCEPQVEEIGATLRIPISLLSSATADTLFAEVSCLGLVEGVHEVLPRLAFSEADHAIGVIAFDPETVTVVVGDGAPPAESSPVPAWGPTPEHPAARSTPGAPARRSAGRNAAGR